MMKLLIYESSMLDNTTSNLNALILSCVACVTITNKMEKNIGKVGDGRHH